MIMQNKNEIEMDKNKNIRNSKASIMCWEFQNLMAKFHINVKEDVI